MGTASESPLPERGPAGRTPRRLLLLNYEFPPAGGGAGNATLQIGRQLASMGVSVHVLTAFIEGEKDGALLHGMRVWRVPSCRKTIHDCGFLGAYSWVGFAAFKRLELHRRFRYDLEHFFFSLPTGILSQQRVPSRRKIPYVVSLRGSDVPGYDLFNKKLELMHGILRPATRRIWRKAGRVVALSQALIDIAHVTAPRQQIDLIPNGIDVDVFSPNGHSRSAAGDGPIRLLCVSRLLERKGIHHLLEALASPDAVDVTLDIIGTGSYEEQLKELCGELGLTDRVRFLGFVRRTDLPAHYRRADLFVLPSQTEAFGLVFAEAMASGLPVLSTRVGGIPALVRDGQDGILVEPGQPVQIRAELERLVADGDRRLAMGESARRRILESYTWSAVATRYLNCYRDVLDGIPSDHGER